MLENNYNQEPSRHFQYPGVMEAPVVGVFDWVVIMILLALPIVNIIMLIVWATDQQGNPNRANFAKATLIIIAVQIVLVAVLVGTMMGTVMAFADKFA